MARGSITKHQGARGISWRVALDIGTNADGRRRQIRRAFPTRRLAEDFLARTLHQLRSGAYAEPSAEPLGAFLERWLAKVPATGVKPVTIYRYRLRCRHLAALADVPLARLTVGRIEAHWGTLLARGLSATTVAQVRTVLRLALADAVRTGDLASNPAAASKAPRVPAYHPVVWTPAQARAFLAAANDDDDERVPGVFWWVLFETMVRVGELVALRWDNVDLEAATLAIRETRTVDADGRPAIGAPKSARSRRTLDLSPSLVARLRWHRAWLRQCHLAAPGWNPTDLVFPNGRGGLLHGAQIGRAFHRRAADLGLPQMRLHDIRHTAATLGLASGIPVKVVSERLGHSSVTITLAIYQHVSADDHRAAAATMAALFGAPGTGPERAVDG
jgi:integrase